MILFSTVELQKEFGQSLGQTWSTSGQTRPNLRFSNGLAGFVIFKRFRTKSSKFGWVLGQSQDFQGASIFL